MDIRALLKDATEAGTVGEVTTYEVDRLRKNGSRHMVEVRIIDYGQGSAGGRFAAEASSPSGRTATGNPADTLDVVLATLHWYELDRDLDEE